MIDVKFTVDLVPEGAGRAKSRAVMTPAGPRVISNKMARTAKWQQRVAEAAAAVLPAARIEEPVRVDVLGLFPRPQRLMRRADPEGMVWHTSRPDRDNLDKNVLDALRTFWRDDDQVVLGTVIKAYHAKDGRPCVVVRIRSAAAMVPEDAVESAGLWPHRPQ